MEHRCVRYYPHQIDYLIPSFSSLKLYLCESTDKTRLVITIIMRIMISYVLFRITRTGNIKSLIDLLIIKPLNVVAGCFTAINILMLIYVIPQKQKYSKE